MKYLKYFGAKRHRFIKSESILAPKGASHFKNENIRCDTQYPKVVSPSSHRAYIPNEVHKMGQKIVSTI